MVSKFDLVVVGAGPAGLIAAKTAAEYGLSVALLERKANIPEITRACGMMLVSLSDPYLGEHVTLNTAIKKICFPHNGFSIHYDGPHRNFYSWEFWTYKGSKVRVGDYETNLKQGDAGIVSATYDKETLLRGLLNQAVANSVKVFSETNVIEARKAREGAIVRCSDGRMFQGRFVLAADGRTSRIVRSLGLNNGRGFFGTHISFGYVMADLDLPQPDVFYTVFMDEKIPMRAYIIPKATDKKQYLVSTSTLDATADYRGAMERFMTQGNYAPWFKHAKKIAFRGCAGNMLAPIEVPFKDNVVIVGDAMWFQEAEMTGAVMSGWKAANAIAHAIKEKNYTKEALQSYLDWWQDAYIKRYDYTQMARGAAMNIFLSDEDIDFIFSNVKKSLPNALDPYHVRGLIGQAMAGVLPLMQQKRPEIIAKLKAVNTYTLNDLLKESLKTGFPNKTQMQN